MNSKNVGNEFCHGSGKLRRNVGKLRRNVGKLRCNAWELGTRLIDGRGTKLDFQQKKVNVF